MDLENLKQLLEVGIPIWILTGGALLCLILDACHFSKKDHWVFGVTVATLILSLYLSFQFWTEGIHSQGILLMDRFTWFFVILIIFVTLLTALNLFEYAKSGGALYCLLLFALVGAIFLFASNHLLVNFIGLEILSLSLYILVGSNREDTKSNEAAMKYFVLGSVASAVLLYGIALIYGSHGSFDLGQITGEGHPAMTLIGGLMIIVGILFKLSIVPFHFWTPDVYEGAPTPITGYMATAVKIAAFAFFIRILTNFDFFPTEILKSVLGLAVILTLVVGNLGAIVQDNVKRMLAYSSIAHAGYALLGLLVAFGAGGFDEKMTSAVLFYLIGYSFMTLGAFAFLSLMVNQGAEQTDYGQLAGLGYRRPGLALLFSLFMISLIGIPPTVGFIAKYGIFRFAIQNGYIYLATLGLIMSVVSAYYYLRPVVYMYFREGSGSIESVNFPVMITLIFCAVAVVVLGIFPMDYLQMAELASQFKP